MVAVIEQFGDSASVTTHQIAFGALVVISVGATLIATRIAVCR